MGLTLAAGCTDTTEAGSEAPAARAERRGDRAAEREADPRAEADPVDWLALDGGPLVRIGRLQIEANECRRFAADPCTEVFVHVEAGALDEASEGDTLFARAPFIVRARDASTVVVAAAREAARPFPARCPTPASEAPPRHVSGAGVGRLPFAGGKLHVTIHADAAEGARHGAFSHLDGDDDLPVPPHTHDASVEALFIVEGDGTMLLGEARSPLAPGQIVYVPAGVRHGYEPGTTRLVAYQVYAPPGPEQRFRQPPPPTFPPPRE